VKEFANMDPIIFVGLNLQVVSYQSLQWAIISLKNDEMTPSVKGLHSRIKEAFGVVVEPAVW